MLKGWEEVGGVSGDYIGVSGVWGGWKGRRRLKG